MGYDPLGRLLAIASPTTYTRFLYDGDALVAEYDGNNAMSRRYVHNEGADVPLLSYAGAGLGQLSYLHADHQGSIVAVSDADGASAINTYDEYGIPGAANTGRFQYTGQAWISELGMYYYKARIYSPTLGRFLQTDPIGYDDQFNLYAYVGNDPVNRTDPSGTQSEPYGKSMMEANPPPRGVTIQTRVTRVPGRVGTAQHLRNATRIASSEGRRLAGETMERTETGNYQKEHGYTVHYDARSGEIVSRLVEGENGGVSLPLIDGNRQLMTSGHAHSGMVVLVEMPMARALGHIPNRAFIEAGPSGGDRQSRSSFPGVPFFVFQQRHAGGTSVSPWETVQY